MTAMAITSALDMRRPLGWWRRFLSTTPGVVVVIAVTVGTLCVLAGLVSAAELEQRVAHRNAVLDHSEPVTYAAQNLYAELSAADAAAVSAFLSGGLQTPAMRERYEQALAGAASALADATAGATDAETRTAVGKTTEQLATYTGLVEAARVNNARGGPIGSAYLREASWLMQTTLLPGVEHIYSADLTALKADQDRVEATPRAAIILTGLCLAAICVGSLIMATRTNRQFNLGLVAAALVALVVIGWIVVASRMAATDIKQSQTETARLEQLANARILASKARTDETLELIAHGDLTAGEKDFHGHLDELTTAIGGRPPATVDGLRKWADSHRKQVQAYLNGDYLGAVTQAIGPGGDASAAQYAIVESSLRTEIDHTRATLRDHVAAAGRALSWSPTGVIILMVVAAATGVAGLWPRLKEFL